ncbi:DMT family transporter [Mesorhizobium sp. CAU 1732]|uniref:DMT family transporter n=1 Tax=Mesorhizobium sp. CAU 1732 TaxID=3140358 RepID=UPI0032609ADD
MQNGVLLALLAYASFSWADAVIKSLGGQIGTFEIAFFTTVFSSVFIYFTKPSHEQWRHFWRTKRPFAVHARALSGIVASVLGIYAFTTIPFAEAYALIFLAPLFVTILSMIFLKEQIGAWRWFAVIAGFVGVMLVVRPGFRALEPGHFSALAVAFLAALTVILLRSLAVTEKRTTMLGYLMAYGIIINGVAMLFTIDALPTLEQTGWLALAGGFAAGGQVALLAATRIAPANQIAPTHYSQIVWAVILGAMFFAEYPDALSLVGLGVLAGAGLLTLVRERVRLGVVRWNPFFRNRL